MSGMPLPVPDLSPGSVSVRLIKGSLSNPLAGQTVELHGLFSMGASLGIAESVEKIVDNLAEVKPTLLFAVPRIFNRIYDGLQKRMETEKPIKRKLFYKGLDVAARRKVLSEKGDSSMLLDLQHKFFDRVVFEKVRARFGGRLKYAFSGAAAISRTSRRRLTARLRTIATMSHRRDHARAQLSGIASAAVPRRRQSPVIT